MAIASPLLALLASQLLGDVSLPVLVARVPRADWKSVKLLIQGGPAMRTNFRARAFTLVELLVVIAVIGLLIGILVPAVQATREAGRKLQCANNLQQIGLALHNRLAAHGKLPPNGVFNFDGSKMVASSPWSAISRILPFLEQESLSKIIDFKIGYNTQTSVSSQRVGTYLCPDERNDRGSGTDPTYGNKHWTLNYAVNLGTWAVLTSKASGMQYGDGAFSPNRETRPVDFRDGMSHTLAIAEVKGYTNRISGGSNTSVFNPPPPPPSSPEELVSSFSLGAFDPAKFTHVEWVDGKVHETGFTTVFPPQTAVSYPSDETAYDIDFVTATESSLGDTYAAVTSRSYHPGGVNALLMDGSARFFIGGIHQEVWRALGSRAGNEVVADY
jgi:prepilin-type N-terminal cleavage/methylation domain-containing protein/prepilin-type processing-associated H-X9-DG protein